VQEKNIGIKNWLNSDRIWLMNNQYFKKGHHPLLFLLLALSLFSSAYADERMSKITDRWADAANNSQDVDFRLERERPARIEQDRVIGKINYRYGNAYAPGESTPFTGKLIEFYKNGNKKLEINYRDGVHFGTTTTYFENGNKNLESYWENGEKTSDVKYYKNFLNFKNYKTTFHTEQYQGYFRPSSVVHYSRYYKLIPFIILIAYGGMLYIRRRNTDYFIKWLVSLSVIIISQSFFGNLLNDPNLDYEIPIYSFIPLLFTVDTVFFIALYILLFLNYVYAISISNAKSLTRHLIYVPLLITLMSILGVIVLAFSPG